MTTTPAAAGPAAPKPGPELYGRKFAVVVANDAGKGLDLSALACRFIVRQSNTQTPNNLELTITNLSAATSSRMLKEFTRVQISAGYDGLYGIIFDGTIVQARRGRQSPTDTFCGLVAVDGDLAYNQALTSRTLAAGSTQADAHGAALNDMHRYGVSQGTTSDRLAQSPALPRGRVLFGMSRDVMRNVARSTRTNWSIQNGKLLIVDELGYLPNQAILITKETGMVDMPTIDPEGVHVRCLLNPLIKPFQRIKLDNNSIQRPGAGVQYGTGAGVGPDGRALSTGTDAEGNPIPSVEAAKLAQIERDGTYTVVAVDHYGDTRGNDWYSELTAVGASQGATIASAQRGRVTELPPAPLPPAAAPDPAHVDIGEIEVEIDGQPAGRIPSTTSPPAPL